MNFCLTFPIIVFLLIQNNDVVTCFSPFKLMNTNNLSIKNNPMSDFLNDDGNGIFEITPTQNSIGANFEIVYEWRILDFDYPTYEQRQLAILNGNFIPENSLPLGIGIWNDRLFVTIPRWKNGIPASLGWLPLPSKERSPLIKPYPNWSEHADNLENNEQIDCDKLISIYRIFIDDCSRLWILDSGVINATIELKELCSPKIVVYDLKTDKQILSHIFPNEQIKQDSLLTNIIVDIRDNNCYDAYAYITDVWRFGLIVFSLLKQQSWRTTNYLFYPNPMASNFQLHGINFQWTDGVFGMSLTPTIFNENNEEERMLFFHPMASFKEFLVPTSVLRNENLWIDSDLGISPQIVKKFQNLGNRGPRSQSTTSGITVSQRVMFYTLVQQDAIGCWDINKPYTKSNLGLVEKNITTLFFPNDLKLEMNSNDGEEYVWVISNRLPMYLYSKLDSNDINFRIQKANVKNSIKNTICDPGISSNFAVEPDIDECY